MKRLNVLSIFLCLIIALLFSCPFVHARDVNGVTVTDFRSGLAYGQHIDHFTAFNPTSTSYVYNEAGGTDADSGEVNLLGNFGAKTLVISVPTLGSTSIDFRLEGKVGTTMTTWSNIYTVNISATTTVDTIIPIAEYITAYRLGVKVNTNGTDVINASTSIINHR
jgi:hypothetical protein